MEDVFKHSLLTNILVREVPVGIIITDISGQICDANIEACRILERDRETLIKTNVVDFTHPDDLKNTHQIIGQVASGNINKADLVKRYILPDGNIIWGRVIVRSLKEPITGERYLAATIENVTSKRLLEEQSDRDQYKLEQARKVAISLMRDTERQKVRAEESFIQLNASMEELRKLNAAVEQSRVSVFITDKNGTIEYVNSFASELCGYSANELIGNNPRILKSGVQSDQFYSDLWSCINGGNVWRGEICNRKKDQSLYWEQVSISPVRNEKGSVTNFVSVKEDITEQRELREALVIAKDQAEAATRAKSAFLAMMSHEIRTPMNGVVGMIDLLTQTKLSGEQARLAGIAKGSSLSLLQIINDILDFSKIEAGHMTLEFLPVAWPGLIEGVAEVLSAQLSQQKLKLYCLVSTNVPSWGYGDPVRLRQVLINLIGNAIKFTKTTQSLQGEICVRIKCEMFEGKSQVFVEIEDNGIGMNSHQLENLFKPFTQADNSIHRQFGGTGLGLSICVQMIELMEGDIGCTSEEGIGSKFWFRVPFEKSEAPEGELAEIELSGCNILLLSGDVIINDYLRSDFTARGADVICSSDLNNCVDIAFAEKIDLVLLDDSWTKQQKSACRKAFSDDKKLKPCRFVILTSDSEQSADTLYPDSILVNSNPFRPSEVRFALAIALGRASPDDNFEEVTNDSINLPSLDVAEASRKLILIVEDNLVNQEIIEHQLNILGYVAEVANNGIEALAHMQLRRFGLVLSDCHMPEMDGFELTRAIREIEHKGKSKVPVIAITANALQGESSRCLAAGMDDYISKPIDLKKLKQLLCRWLPQSKQTVEQDLKSTQDANNNAKNNQVLDLQLLVSVLGDDIQTQQKILHKFIVRTGPDIACLISSAETEDWTNMNALGHKIKSSALSIGAVVLSDICTAFEKSGEATEVTEIEELSRYLKAEFDRVTEHIKNHY